MKDLANSIAVVSTLDPDTRTADANGTISMTEAILFATTSAEGFMDHFMDTYKHFTLSERVDLGELEQEHTDWCLDRIAALVFD